MGKRRKTHQEEDQYGARGSSDRDAHRHAGGGRLGGGRGGRGGRGGASSSSSGGQKGVEMEYAPPAVPKFLQAHAHLLRGTGGRPELGAGPSASSGLGADQQLAEEADIADAAEDVAFGLQTALAQNPELAEKHPELAAVADKARAEEIKTRANSLFGKKQYKESIEEYDKALELDRTNHVVYSNRAAALIELGEFEQAVESARSCVKCAGGKRYAKGYFRLGLALFKMGRAKESVFHLRRAKELEPDLQGVDEVLFRAVGMAEQAGKEVAGAGAGGRGGGGGGGGEDAPRASVRPQHTLLSFAEEDDEF